MSRFKILNKIKTNLQTTEKVAHPGTFITSEIDGQAWLFAEQIKKAGGFLYSLEEESQAFENIKEKFKTLKNIYSYNNSKILQTNFEMTKASSPHSCQTLDLLVIKANLAIAENGAVWVTEPKNFPRAALFLTQHLFIHVDIKNIVSNMHTAYEQIQDFPEPFGAWIAGPSKTADVEQCLVIGAHGPRSLTILLNG